MPELIVLPPRMDIESVIGLLDDCSQMLNADAYLVGGFVRDRLLGRPLVKDIDVVVVGSDGVRLLDEVSARMRWSRPAVFEKFGTAMTQGDGFTIEVVRARSERYDPASRKPEVREGTLTDDIRRRDFTVNSLAQTFNGKVLDLDGRGIEDLRRGILRTPLPPAETFSEDPLRMFRAARFVSQLGFTPAPGLAEAMKLEAHRVSILSQERIRDELCKLLLGDYPEEGMRLLRDTGLIDQALPELSAMAGVEQGGWHHLDVWDHTMSAVKFAPRRMIDRVAALFHDCGKPATHAVTAEGKHTFYDHAQVGAEIAASVMERLRFSGEQIESVTKLVRLHLRPIQYKPDTHSDAAVRRLIREAGGLRREMLDLARADTHASLYPDVNDIDELESRMARLDAGDQVSKFRPALDGKELMEIYQRKSGPWVGRVQRALLEATLEGEIPTRDADAARAWLQTHPEVAGE